MNSPLVLTLDAAAPLSAVGGKALNLSRLYRAGFPVPPGGFVIFQFDRCLEPVRFHDQEIARQVFERSLSGSADEEAFPAIARDCAHHYDVSGQFSRFCWQLFVRQSGNQVRVFVVYFVETRYFLKALLVILVHLPFDFI